jgi:hypothetical protein
MRAVLVQSVGQLDPPRLIHRLRPHTTHGDTPRYGASWQRCRTHYTANVMQVTPKSRWGWVKALLHSVYDQPDAAAAHLDHARPDILACTAYP